LVRRRCCPRAVCCQVRIDNKNYSTNKSKTNDVSKNLLPAADFIRQGESDWNGNNTLPMISSAKLTKNSFKLMIQCHATKWTLLNQVTGKSEAKQKHGSSMGLKLTCVD
jgi:hypothetical protein